MSKKTPDQYGKQGQPISQTQHIQEGKEGKAVTGNNQQNKPVTEVNKIIPPQGGTGGIKPASNESTGK